MPASDIPRYVSIADAADAFGVHHSTIRRWISEGRIRGYRFGERIIRVCLTEIEESATPLATANRGA